MLGHRAMEPRASQQRERRGSRITETTNNERTGSLRNRRKTPQWEKDPFLPLELGLRYVP